MKKSISIMVFFIAVLLSLTACGGKAQKDYGNGYIPETDFPLMYEASIDGTYIAESETGYYFINGHFLFYMDKSTMEPVPLCNKPDCKHMDETDDTKVYYCNAYLKPGGPLPFIQYYENELYAIEGFNTTTKNMECTLVKIFPDGSGRERLLRVPDNCVCGIHRGYFYTARNGGKASIVRVPLNQLDSEPEVVFESELDSSSFFLTMKGNYLLIENWGIIDADKSYHTQLFTCNILTGETVQIMEDEESSGITPSLYKSNDERLLYSKNPSYVENAPLEEENIIYSSDLNGDNETVFQDFREKTDKYCVRLSFDGTYYYEEWVNYMLDDEDQAERQFNIYDKEFHLLYQGDLKRFPKNYWIVYGNGPYMFFSYADPETKEHVIDYVDKSLFEQGRFESKRLVDYAPTPPIGW